MWYELTLKGQSSELVLTFPGGDEGIDNDLCTIEKVPELGLPEHQVSGALHTEAILKP